MPVFDSIPASGLNKARSTCCNVIVIAYKASRILLNLLKALYVSVSVRIPRRGCIFKSRSDQCHISSLFNLCAAWFQLPSNKTKELIRLCTALPLQHPSVGQTLAFPKVLFSSCGHSKRLVWSSDFLSL